MGSLVFRFCLLPFYFYLPATGGTVDSGQVQRGSSPVRSGSAVGRLTGQMETVPQKVSICFHDVSICFHAEKRIKGIGRGHQSVMASGFILISPFLRGGR